MREERPLNGALVVHRWCGESYVHQEYLKAKILFELVASLFSCNVFVFLQLKRLINVPHLRSEFGYHFPQSSQVERGGMVRNTSRSLGLQSKCCLTTSYFVMFFLCLALEVYSPAILDFLTNTLTSAELDARQLASCMYGLRSFKDADPHVLRLVDALATITGKFPDVNFTAQAVSNMLYGLQGLSSDSPEVRRLLSSLASLLAGVGGMGESGEILSAQGVGNALYGLQGLKSDCQELQDLIQRLQPLVAKATLDGQAIGNALYGLQSMKSEVPEVQHLLETLAEKVTAFEGKLTEQVTWLKGVARCCR